MLGVSESTLFRVREEVKASHFSGGKLTTPSRKRPRNAEKRRRSAKFDSFTLCALRPCVHDFFRRNEVPTVEKAVYCASPACRNRLQTRSRNSLLIDRDDITDWPNRYLRDVERYRAEGRKIFSLDETSVTAGHTRSIVWTDTVLQKRGRLGTSIAAGSCFQTKRNAASPMFSAISLRQLTAHNQRTEAHTADENRPSSKRGRPC
ncbi:hypothetical protein HPB52_004665 [Rhipicephalus sanguineus]|uniref:Transposase n=1 Tax=Rhipicephalus sanguineus TaxID=34632 RepID=A0A9D4T742_RHISA|nr:hypothetical protein HPB52_004665 [Rhipicephalus sanguineus]